MLAVILKVDSYMRGRRNLVQQSSLGRVNGGLNLSDGGSDEKSQILALCADRSDCTCDLRGESRMTPRFFVLYNRKKGVKSVNLGEIKDCG